MSNNYPAMFQPAIKDFSTTDQPAQIDCRRSLCALARSIARHAVATQCGLKSMSGSRVCFKAFMSVHFAVLSLVLRLVLGTLALDAAGSSFSKRVIVEGVSL
jgi:hypothetical protein